MQQNNIQKMNVVFVIHTMYQAYLSMKIVTESQHFKESNIIILDAIINNNLDREQFKTINLNVIKLKIEATFIKQIVNANSNVEEIIKEIGDVHILYIFNDVEPTVALLAKHVKIKSGHIIFVEEGLSAYRVIPEFSLEYLKGVAKKIICGCYGFKYNINFGNSQYIEKLMLTNPKLFIQNHPSNKTEAEYFSNDLSKFFRQHGSLYRFIQTSIKNSIKYPAILYLGQPLSESGITDQTTERKFLIMMRRYCSDNDINLYIKMHPMEKLDKYEGIDCLPSKIPAEVMINILAKDELILISAFSSVNFNFAEHDMLGNLHIYRLLNIKANIPNVPVDTVDNFDLFYLYIRNCLLKKNSLR